VQFLPSLTQPSILKMNQFDDIPKLTSFLTELSTNEAKYEEYFAWKDSPPEDRFNGIIDMSAYKYSSMCRICEAVHNSAQQQ